MAFKREPRPPFIRFSRANPWALFKRGWNEIPEVMGAGAYGVLGLFILMYVMYDYQKNERYNRRYKTVYTIYRPNDERICRIRKFDNSPQPTYSPPSIRELYERTTSQSS